MFNSHSGSTRRSIERLVFIAVYTMLLSLGGGGAFAQNDKATSGTLDQWAQLYEDRVALFKKENAELVPGKKYVVFVGDSLTHGMPYKKLYPEFPVLNRGISSDGTAQFPKAEPPFHRGVTNRLEASILDTQPAVLFILIGTNDVGSGISLDYWLKNLESILDRVNKELPDCKVVLHTLPPSGPPYKRVENLNPKVIEYNERLRDLARERNLPIIDLHKLFVNADGILPPELTGDGLHLKRPAYDLWAAEARKYIPESLAEKK